MTRKTEREMERGGKKERARKREERERERRILLMKFFNCVSVFHQNSK